MPAKFGTTKDSTTMSLRFNLDQECTLAAAEAAQKRRQPRDWERSDQPFAWYVE